MQNMSSKTPTIRQIAWISIIPQLAFMGLVILIWHFVYPENAVIHGAATYLIISYSLRSFIAKDHKNGMRNVKSGKFSEAIPDFEKSYNFFKQNNWIDKYRFLTLLSSSRMSYKEMALNNIAFSYGQSGNGEKSKEYYERTLVEFPESEIAKSALRLLNSMKNNN